MRLDFNVVIISILLFLLTSCGSIITISYSEPVNETRQENDHESKTESTNPNPSGCERCSVIPKSGLNRDLRYGYYFNREEGKCIRISYSTGPGCVPPPFETFEECTICCGGQL